MTLFFCKGCRQPKAPSLKRKGRTFRPGLSLVNLASKRSVRRDHPGPEMLLHEHQNTQQHREQDAVNEGAREDVALMPPQVADSRPGGDILRRNHLGENA